MKKYNVVNVGGEILNLDGPLSLENANDLASEIEADDIRVVEVSIKKFKLDTDNDGFDEILHGNSREEVLFDVLHFHDIEELKPHWSLEEVEILPVEVCGNVIEYDKSGVGHCWVPAEEIDCPANIQQDIECEIIDGGKDSCEDYLASNGIHYRW